MEYLMQEGGYTKQQVLDMNRTFPSLLTLSIQRQLYPKLRFLKETLKVHPKDVPIPPQYFGARLERTLAPRHAFLVHVGLPHGQQLLDNDRWQDFLLACRKTKRFAALCQSWQRELQRETSIKPRQIEAFDVLFGRGLMAAARNELVQQNNAWPLDYINVTSSDMIRLLIQHGACPTERDHGGATLLHWASGTGNLQVVKELLSHINVWTRTERDGATALHWAAAGINAQKFGCGGHADVCRHLMEQVGRERKEYVNQLTLDGNSAVMWAAWSGTLETVKLLVRNRANVHVANRNGCTIAHWAASGGNLKVCHYLANTVAVDFTVPNHGGNTPLTHAVAFGHAEVVQWLGDEIVKDGQDDSMAYSLAQDFVHWTEGDRRRKQILQLFQDWYAYEEGGAVVETAPSDANAEEDFY